MVRLRDGVSTCREHGGEYPGDLAAADHLQTEHAELWAMLSGARAYAVPTETDDDAFIASLSNRAARRRRRRR